MRAQVAKFTKQKLLSKSVSYTGDEIPSLLLVLQDLSEDERTTAESGEKDESNTGS